MKSRRGSVEKPGLDVLGQFRELMRQVEKGILSPAHLQALIEHRNPFEDLIDVQGLLADWQKFYLEIFGIDKDFSGLVIPPHQAGLDRLIVVAGGLTPNRLFEACRKLFPSWRYVEDLDAIKSERAADHDYAVWVRDRREADEEFKNLSARDLDTQGVFGITLEERLVYELKFFMETGGHLDIESWTLCSGSRGPGGRVPGVSWDRVHGGMDVYWCAPDFRHGDLRARAVVSA